VYDIWTATRTCNDCLFSEPVPVTKCNTAYNDIHSFVSPDGLCLYFASNRDGYYQLFKSTRKDTRYPFGEPVVMSMFDTPGGENMFPCLSPDGTEFYFMRQDIGQRSTRDICVSYRID
jgi:Tol biopolymer transport system component